VILWQGEPDFATTALRTIHLRTIGCYFAILGVTGIYSRLASGTPVTTVAIAISQFAALALGAIVILTVFAWLVSKTTVYTITNRRVVLRFGVALPITIQIPFKEVIEASVKRFANGAGDVSLTVQGKQRIGYLLLWPHARPWKYTSAQPTFRGIANVNEVAALLGRALAASAEQPAQPLTVLRKIAKRDSRLAATA
jgi:hypothetical protein